MEPEWASAFVAVCAVVVSLAALWHAHQIAADVAGGTFAIDYREHVLHLHDHGLDAKQIVALLQKEPYRAKDDPSEVNGYDGPAGKRLGLKAIATVEDILENVKPLRQA